MSYGWLLRAISRFRTLEEPPVGHLCINFIIDVHLNHGTVVSKGPECEGCALCSEPPPSLSGPGVLDDAMARLKTVCDVLDRVFRYMCPLLRKLKIPCKIKICRCAQLDPDIWEPRLRTWFPESMKYLYAYGV